MFPKEISAFLERGGTLSWGLVPSTDELIGSETAEDLAKMLKKNIEALASKGVDQIRILKGSIISPQCGLGGMDVKNVDKVLDMLSGVSERMQGYYRVGK
jgi:methylmalonyl-CoA mutase cobalamin-binding subunit